MTPHNHLQSPEKIRADRRRLKILWAGLAVYFVGMMNAIRFAFRVPYQAVIVGALINAAMIVAFFMAIVKVQRRLNR